MLLNAIGSSPPPFFLDLPLSTANDRRFFGPPCVGKRQQAASATNRSGRREVPSVEGVGRGERGDKLSTVALFLGRSAKVLGAPRARLPEDTSQAQRAI
jgi:hypothetical protein